MIPLYRPGTSLVHRVPAWLKLVLLVALGVTVALWRDDWRVAATAWCVVVLGYLLAGRGQGVFSAVQRGLTDLAQMVWRLKWLAVLILVPQLLFREVDEAAITTLRILAIILLAGLFTLTTRVSDVLDLLLALLRPLDRMGLGKLGLTAERAALSMALTMRSVPTVFGYYSEIRQARQARGAKTGAGGVVSMTTPLLVMSLRHAEQTAEALAARGVR